MQTESNHIEFIFSDEEIEKHCEEINSNFEVEEIKDNPKEIQLSLFDIQA